MGTYKFLIYNKWIGRNKIVDVRWYIGSNIYIPTEK